VRMRPNTNVYADSGELIRFCRRAGDSELEPDEMLIEALQRLVWMEPLRRTHECVFAVLAFEGEPVDPRI